MVSALGLRIEHLEARIAARPARPIAPALVARWGAQATDLRSASVKLRLAADVWNSRQSGGLIDLGLAGCKLSKGKEQDDGEP